MVDTFSSPGKDYLFTADPLAAIGLRDLLSNSPRELIVKPTDAADLSHSLEEFDGEACERLIVYLSREPASLLIALKKTAVYLMQPNAPSQVVIITPYSFNWLYHTLRPLVSPELLRKVIAIDAGISVEAIASQLATPVEEEDCLPIQARKEEIMTGKTLTGLTRREYDCVLDFFCGVSLQEPLYSQKSSATATRYSQRNAGLRKLIHQLPSIATTIREKRNALNR